MGMVARSRAERHEREWISVAAHLERAPVRFTLTFAFGDMPEGWNQSRRGASTWAGFVGVVLLTPFITLLAARSSPTWRRSLTPASTEFARPARRPGRLRILHIRLMPGVAPKVSMNP